MAQAEIRNFVKRAQDDLYFGPDNLRVVLARMDERFGNTAANMDERLRNTEARMDERLASMNERLVNMDASMNERLASMDASMNERLVNMDSSMNERLVNMDARMDERLRNTANKEDIANLKISMTRWFLGSSLTLVGIIVTVFKWLLP